MSKELSPQKPQQTFLKTVGQTLNKAGEAAGEAARKGAQLGVDLAQNVAQTAQNVVGGIPRTLGEDYYAILAENPLALDTLSRAHLLVENRELLATAFNIPWATALLWSAASGNGVAPPQAADQATSEVFHYGPGQIKQWEEINKFLDKAVGIRQKFNRSVDCLPQIVEQFGLESVPAYFMRLLQDATTVVGVPLAPHDWDRKQSLQLAQVPRQAATGLISVSFSTTLGVLGVIGLVNSLWEFGEGIIQRTRLRGYLKTATAALENRDYNAAVTNYQRALEVERSPYVLMAMGQVYLQRAAHRLRAHQIFTEAVTMLAMQPDAAAPYKHASLSVRGLAGLQALATADVLANIHPEHWNGYVQDLVNATVFSFASTASAQAEGYLLTPDALVPPTRLSAAINYYLAAKAACCYPFAEQRQEVVTRNLRAALRSLGLAAQYDEKKLRPPVEQMRQLWAMELLPPPDVEMVLAGS